MTHRDIREDAAHGTAASVPDREGSAELRRPLRFGPDATFTLDGRMMLAPMAGTSERVFRRICHEMGAALTVTELVSARGIVYSGLKASYRYLLPDPEEGPMMIQLFGFDPADLEEATRRILADERLAGPDVPLVGIDLNMGCPVEKVVKTGAGAALMKPDAHGPALLEAIRRGTVAAGREELAVTAKIRLGFAKGELTAPAIASDLVRAGADMIAIHGRTRQQFYRGDADLEGIRRTVEAARETAEKLGRRVPFVGNGDISDVPSARAMMARTGADAVMVGRAAEGNPWIFELTDHKPPVEARVPVVRRHAAGLAELLGEEVAMREFRKTLIRYLHGSRDAARLRRMASGIETLGDVEGVLAAWVDAYREDAPDV